MASAMRNPNNILSSRAGVSPRGICSFALVIALFFTVALPSFAAQSTHKKPTHTSAKSKKPTKKTASKKKKRKPLSAAEIRRMQRMKHTFVASSTLKPMAKQLLEFRTKPAYTGVEAFAVKHAGTEEGAMANLVLGYAHILDREYPQAVPYLRKAQIKSGELGDYIAYFTAQAESGSADPAQTVAALETFQQKYPDSIFTRDAASMYVIALVTNGDYAKAIAVAQKYRNPPRADIELNLGRAYMKSGDTQRAIATLQHLYYTMPLSFEADAAANDLRAVNGLAGSYSDRKTRADLLMQGKRYREAASEYSDLLSNATPAQSDELQVALAIAEYRGGDYKNARKALEDLQVSGEANAQRLYFLADIARSEGDEDRFTNLLLQLRQAGPTSGWLEQGLLSSGNMYLLKKDYDRAIDSYRELAQRFPKGRWGHYAHWKAAWLSLRQGRTDEARTSFEQQIGRFPDSAEIPAALYWRGRMAEDDKNVPLARAYYAKLISRFMNYYYADRARDRMKLIGTGAVATEPMLDHIPGVNVPTTEEAEIPADDLRVQKSRLLENCAMFDFAVKELQRASADGGSDWATPEIARLYQESGGYHRALNYMKRTVPSYFALDYSALPRNYWETLFPRPFWNDLKRYSDANNLDPYLVASLIRQESEFNPGAVSHANALGLMQVLPGTGKKLAKEVRMHGFSSNQLLVPNTNIQLGTRYFKQLLDKFDGHPEYALAAYNAGSDRVETWLEEGKFRDAPEFVESIPFTETREYVQAIMRNASVYKKLYPTP